MAATKLLVQIRKLIMIKLKHRFQMKLAALKAETFLLLLPARLSARNSVIAFRIGSGKAGV